MFRFKIGLSKAKMFRAGEKIESTSFYLLIARRQCRRECKRERRAVWFVASKSGVKWIQGGSRLRSSEIKFARLESHSGKLANWPRTRRGICKTTTLQFRRLSAVDAIFRGKSWHIARRKFNYSVYSETRLIFLDQRGPVVGGLLCTLYSHVVARNFKESNTLAECLKFPRVRTRVRPWEGLLSLRRGWRARDVNGVRLKIRVERFVRYANNEYATFATDWDSSSRNYGVPVQRGSSSNLIGYRAILPSEGCLYDDRFIGWWTAGN